MFRRKHWRFWMTGMWALGLTAALAGSWLGASQALAQDADEPVADAPPAAAPAAPAGQQQPPKEQMSTLVWFFKAMGVRYVVVFLLLSFFLVALIIMNLLGARREAIVPMGLVEGFEACLNEKKFQEAYELAKADESFLGKVLAAGLAKLSQGYPQAIESMQEIGEEENMRLEHRLSYISLIGAISPMCGLLGTVDGMVGSFIKISQAETAPRPAELAEGISTALITTLVGLILAIPAVSIYGILKNRMARLTHEVGVMSEGLMSRFQNVGGKKA